MKDHLRGLKLLLMPIMIMLIGVIMLFPVNVKAEDIDSVSATITMPVIGEHPVMTGTPGDAEKYDISQVNFYCDSNLMTESDVFEAGKTYQIYVNFNPVNSQDDQILTTASAVVNGSEASYYTSIGDGRGTKAFTISCQLDCSVSFDVDGGTAIDSQLVEPNGNAVKPVNDPVKDGFKFDNWYTDENHETVFDFDNTPITANTTIYANWIQIVFDVTSADFGAVANDGNDDWQAINSALARAKTTSETIEVHVPAGTYHISKTLYIFSNTKLILDQNAEIVSTSTTDLSVMLTGDHVCEDDTCTHGGYTQLENIEISGGTWNRNGNATYLSGAFVLQHGHNISIHDLTISNCSDHIINVSADKDVTITNVTFNNHFAYTGDNAEFWGDHAKGDAERYNFVEAIHTDYAGEGEKGALPLDNTVCQNITVDGCTFTGVLAGVGTHHESQYRAVGITVKDCEFNEMRYGAAINAWSFDSFVAEGNTTSGVDKFIAASDTKGRIEDNDLHVLSGLSSAQPCDYGVIHLTDSDFVINSNDIDFAQTSAIAITRGKATITNNTVSQTLGDAIKINETTIVDIENNTLKMVSGYGIFMKSCAGDNVIKGNEITPSYGTLTLTNTYGVFLEKCNGSNIVDNNTISCSLKLGNICFQESKGKISNNILKDCTNRSIYCLSSDVEILSNTMENSGTAVFVENGTATIKDNIINKATSNGIRVDAASTVTINSNKINDVSGYGINATNVSSSLNVENNTFSGSGETGISVSSCGGSNTIKGNTIPYGTNNIILSGYSGTISNNTLSNSSSHSLNINGGFVTVSDNKISNAGDNGIFANSVNSATYSNNTISGSASNGIRINKGADVVVKSNTISSSGNYGIGVSNAGSTRMEVTYNKVSGNTESVGIYVEKCPGTNKINNNEVKCGKLAGIWIVYCNATISNNTVTGCLGDALLTLGQESNKVTITANDNTFKTASSSNYDIRLYSYSVNCVLQDNNLGSRGITAAGGVTYTVKGFTGLKDNIYYENGNKSTYTGLVQSSGTWYYVKSGVVDTSATTLVQHGGNWYYVQKGVLVWGVRTLVQYGGTWYYVNNSTVDFGYTGIFGYGGTDYYIQKGVIKWGVNGLTSVGGTWYYLNNSAVKKDFTSLVQYNGTWYYVQKGVLDFGYTGIVPYSGTDYYVQKGQIKWGVNGLTNVGGTWYYLNNSAVKKGYTGLVSLNGTWYYVQKGQLIWGVRTLVQHEGTWYYVNNSTLDWKYTGICTYSGTDYYVQKGVLKWGVNGLTNVGGTWYYLSNSAVKKGYTGLVSLNGTWYYVQSGVLKWGVRTLVQYNGTWYYVNNSTLDWNYTGICSYGGTDYYVQKGVLKWGVNGLTNVGGTWYYLNNSAVKRNYTGLVEYNNTLYYVQKGVLVWGYNGKVNYNGKTYNVSNSIAQK